MAKTMISIKRSTYWADGASFVPPGNDAAPPRPFVELGSGKGTGADANITLQILIQTSTMKQCLRIHPLPQPLRRS
jgi:hypothetical protein